jgi:hypothetical protein
MAYPTRCVTVGCGGLAEARSSRCIRCELGGRGGVQPGPPEKPVPRPLLRRGPPIERIEAYSLCPLMGPPRA